MAMAPYWNLGEEEDEEASCFGLSLISDVLYPTLKAVVDLNIIDIIKKCGPGAHLSPSEIAAKLSTNNPAAPSMLRRMLDLLVTHSIFTVTLPDGSDERRYGLAPVCKFLLPNEDGVSFAPFIQGDGSRQRTRMASTLKLKEAVLGGGDPFEKAHGMSFYEYSGRHPEHQKEFHKAMSDHSTLFLNKLIKTYKGFQGLNSLVDVGGGNGATLAIILSHYPQIKGVNFDQPHVIADSPLPHSGIQHVGGDMFVSVPKGDAVFLKWICHCFQDQECINILKTCYHAVPEEHGKVIICEYLLPDPKETSPNTYGNPAVHLDINMLVLTGGKERTEKEFKALALAAGFQGFRVAANAYNVKIMELFKNK